MNLFSRLKELFSKNEDINLFEKNLLLSDFEYSLTKEIIEKLKKFTKDERSIKIKDILKEYLLVQKFTFENSKLNILNIVGVNGVGKTTAISKIANFYKNRGFSPIIAAADTFRAAAIEQLTHWADKLNIEIIKQKQGADPAAVVYDSIDKAMSNEKKYNLLIIDTAGRLQNKEELMQQLNKIVKVIDKKKTQYLDKINYHSTLVIDANLGKNSFNQAEIFKKIINIDSIGITKLDSTAKGGAIFSICNLLKLPISFASFGEKIEDYLDASENSFIDILLNKI
ncbi:MAG: signal recognition particle-docking protein FtsY [Spirochaetales bacterium]|nr:signal recognition particle-docking protein FtsY [Exilispira sp.]NMC66730.1 signal recognition particle-docking protein FtsY [Spirochaetales bacterium]